MVTIDIWRARIGAHHASISGSGFLCASVTFDFRLLQVTVIHFLVFMTLLVIGNVEINPGPQEAEFLCPFGMCSARFVNLGEHSKHQQLHANLPNFRFECGICKVNFSSFNSLSSHVSKCHQEFRKVQANRLKTMSCFHCQESFSVMKDLCHHLMNEHIGQQGINVTCPLQELCLRFESFTTKSNFYTHLSRCHHGWCETAAFSDSSGSVPSAQHPSAEAHSFTLHGENLVSENDTSIEEDFSDAQETFSFKEDDLFDYILTFYLMLEVQYLLPVSTIDKVAESLTYISEVIQQSLRITLTKELQILNIPPDQIRTILCKMVSSDPLYLTHHKNTRGPDLMTDHLRKKHFMEKYPQVPVAYPNLNQRDPIDGERYAYVSVQDTLSRLLQDSSIQQEVQESFDRNVIDNGDLYTDYIDGAVCKARNLPPKRIDLLIFQDSFNATSMLTSVQEKNRTLGVYVTVGNLRPWQRTKLRAMHLIMLVLEKHVKKYRQKCFTKLAKELKDLEKNGINIKGEKVPVFVQFCIGDNLGSHFLGGFVESFTATHCCRYCEVSKNELINNPTAIKPFRTLASYTQSALKAIGQQVRHHRGVKELSVLNQLSHYKVTDPGLPGCLGHDLYHGVVDVDLSSIITSFIARKWFTHELLCRRIAQFKYALIDSKNKPAPFKNKGKKKKKTLGGSAVQNWLLLRLLPFLINDKIQDKNDKHWQLYLKLKKICEFTCAPALSSEQINELDRLIQSYLLERRILPNAQLPKHHYLRHYPELIRHCGPLIHLWGMRFEQKHQFFKKVARTCNNFINLLKTLSSKFQLLFAYESLQARFKNVLTNCHLQPVEEFQFSSSILAVINVCNTAGDSQLLATKKINVNGLNYCKGDLLVLGKDGLNLKVGWIEAIVVDGATVHFVIKNNMANFDTDLGLYQIVDQRGHLTLLRPSNLIAPCVQPVYPIGHENYISLKHSIP